MYIKGENGCREFYKFPFSSPTEVPSFRFPLQKWQTALKIDIQVEIWSSGPLSALQTETYKTVYKPFSPFIKIYTWYFRFIFLFLEGIL